MLRCRSTKPAGPKPEKAPPEWRLTKALNGGGYLVNWGCYDMDFLFRVVGWSLRPKTVFAQTWPIAPYLASHIASGSDAETYYAALIRCECGAVISLERGEHMAAPEEDSWQIIGTTGSLTLQMTTTGDGAPKRIILDECTEAQGLGKRTVWEVAEDSSDATFGPIQDFARAILDNRAPATTLERAMIVQAVTDGVYKSSETGQSVGIEI